MSLVKEETAAVDEILIIMTLNFLRVQGKPQLGTWQSHANLSTQDVVKLPRSRNLTETQAATMSVNMSTAYRMIRDYLPRPACPGK
jgi:NADPH:quinone reductase-like Zn-dependent oxidoreductase